MEKLLSLSEPRRKALGSRNSLKVTDYAEDKEIVSTGNVMSHKEETGTE